MKEELVRLNVKDIMPNSLINQDRDRTVLSSSVAQYGVLEPFLVRRHRTRRGKYEIVYGQGRWEAAKKAGVKQIWVLVRDCNDLELLKLAGQENFARSNPSPIQEGELLRKLRDLGCSIRELANEFNISTGQVVERIKLVEVLPEKAKRAINQGRVAASTFEYVRSNVKDPTTQAQVFETVVQKDLDMDSAIELVKGVQPTSEVYEKAEEFRSPITTKTKTEDITTIIETKQSRVIRGADGSLLVRDSQNHRDRDLPEELRQAWLTLQEGDLVEFSFRHTRSVHTVNTAATSSGESNAG